jgi:hypothetical protein
MKRFDICGIPSANSSRTSSEIALVSAGLTSRASGRDRPQQDDARLISDWRKGDAKGKIVSEGIAQVIDGMDNPLLASALFGEAGVLGVQENENATVRLICSGGMDMVFKQN